ncbi:MAG: hypothetical protein AAB242_00305 [Nitrospirota bacterium]
MASNRLIRPVIVTCLLSVAVLLGGCSPPLPKTLLSPPDGTMYDIHLSCDAKDAIMASPLTARH